MKRAVKEEKSTINFAFASLVSTDDIEKGENKYRELFSKKTWNW